MPKHSDLATRFWSKVRKTAGCWLWTASTDHKGYGKFGVRAGGRPRTVQAHRVAYELEVGPIPTGMALCHHCDTPLCVRPSHMFIGTVADNMRDMARKGRASYSQAKLTPEQVRAIRSRYVRGQVTLTTVAEEFGVSFQLVSLIVRRVVWANVA